MKLSENNNFLHDLRWGLDNLYYKNKLVSRGTLQFYER